MHFDQQGPAPPRGLRGNRVLTPHGIGPAAFTLDGLTLGRAQAAPGFLDAGDLLVLPGIVDVHGDALERSVRPRPKVAMPVLTALLDVDAQVLGHGITTAFHGVTVSWEGGLRSVPSARRVLDALRDHPALFGADHRIHLRFETRFQDGLDAALEWIEGRRVDLLSINDHWPQIAASRDDPASLAKFADRAECDVPTFMRRLVDAESDDATATVVGRLMVAARAHGLVVASHDDPDASHRRRMSELGCGIAEFPLTVDAAREARRLGDHIVFGAPNVLRGGSHVGAPPAEEMVKAGLCDVLASDYFYPSPLIAAFELAARGVTPFAEAWNLVSRNAAVAVGLHDRGVLAHGQRADVVLVDDRLPTLPRVVACFVAGRLRFASRSLAGG